MFVSARKQQAGFGLIEVLIALLIVSVGLLGIAALQIVALKNVGSSMERSQAVIQTYSYMDLLRANKALATGSGLDLPLTCNATALGASKVEQRKWINAIHDTLGPDSCGKVTCLSNQCSITIQWDDSRAEGGSTTQQLVTETLL
jgi:type IV pilus assembly protein PilV